MHTLLMNLAESAPADYSSLFVVLLGMGVVFVGLISIIVLCMITGALLRSAPSSAQEETAPAPAPIAAAPAEIPRKQELIAAVSAAIAEDMGTDVSAIRILSIKRL